MSAGGHDVVVDVIRVDVIRVDVIRVDVLRVDVLRVVAAVTEASPAQRHAALDRTARG